MAKGYWKVTYKNTTGLTSTIVRHVYANSQEEAMKEGRRSYYLLFTLYKEELKKREEGLSRLDMQMQRFNE